MLLHGFFFSRQPSVIRVCGTDRRHADPPVPHLCGQKTFVFCRCTGSLILYICTVLILIVRIPVKQYEHLACHRICGTGGLVVAAFRLVGRCLACRADGVGTACRDAQRLSGTRCRVAQSWLAAPYVDRAAPTAKRHRRNAFAASCIAIAVRSAHRAIATTASATDRRLAGVGAAARAAAVDTRATPCRPVVERRTSAAQWQLRCAADLAGHAAHRRTAPAATGSAGIGHAVLAAAPLVVCR